MATVKIGTPREQSSSFGLYRTSAGGDESIVVRRKVGEPTDVNHTNSGKLARQRYELTLASQHYARLTPSQKAITRHQFEEVEYQKSHGKTDTKLLKGRQLFISKEMHSLETTQKQLVLPHELCIMLVDYQHNPLDGQLKLSYLKAGDWIETGKEQLRTGSWLFSQVPRGQAPYRPFGSAIGHYDPQHPEYQNMSEKEILSYPYHVLYSGTSSPGYVFASAYWLHSYPFVAPFNVSTVRVESTLHCFDFDGTLKIGLKDYVYPSPLPEWRNVSSFGISRHAPDPKEVEVWLLGCGLEQGVTYSLCHELVGNMYNYWRGSVRYWLS